jgi:hypothetical protein
MTCTVTSIEVHEIADLGFAEWADFPLRHMYGKDGMTKRTIYIAHTDTGLVGYGESGTGLLTQARVSGVPQDPFASPPGPRAPSPDSLKRTGNPPAVVSCWDPLTLASGTFG